MDEKKEKRRAVWRIIFIFALLGIFACLSFVAYRLYSDWKAEKDYREAAASVAVTPEETPEPEPTETAEEIEAAEFTGERDGEAAKLPDGIFSGVGNPINFAELKAINDELYAWIRIPNTNIDYPIAQSATDDFFYLNHDMYKGDRFAGCIYTESGNSKNFTDPNTVVYGHNMRNGSMFQNLHYYEDPEFFEQNPFIYIYTEDKIRIYEIFASYIYDDRHILNSFNFNDPKVFAQYLDDIIHVHSMDKNIRTELAEKIDNTCRILTLTTCIGSMTENRYLVQGVLVWEGTEEELDQTMTDSDAEPQTAPTVIPEATQ